MKQESRDLNAEDGMKKGIYASFFLHVVGAVVCLLMMNYAEARDRRAHGVFTVTVEGGEALGGVSQVPQPGKETEKPPQDVVPEEIPDAEPPPQSKKEEPKTAKEEKKPEKSAESEKTKDL